MSRLWLVCLVLLGTAACRPESVSAQAVRQPIIPETSAMQQGLHSAWVTRVRVDSSRGRVNDVVLSSGLLLVTTNLGGIQALNAETGRSLWATQVGKPDYPTMAASSNDAFVAVTNGSTLYVLDRHSGGLVWELSLGGSPCTGCAVGADKVFVPITGGGIEGYKLLQERAADRHPDRIYGSGEISQAPLISAGRIHWATFDGVVQSISLGDTYSQFRFRTRGAVNHPVSHGSGILLAGSSDGYAYGINDSSGEMMWQFSVGSSVAQQPVAVGDAAYVIADGGGMSRLGLASGAPQWWAMGVKGFLAASATRLYVTDHAGRLVILDQKTGARLGSISAEPLDLRLVNSQTDRIYLGTHTGLLQCLHEREVVAKGPGDQQPKPGAEPTATPAAPSPFGNNPG